MRNWAGLRHDNGITLTRGAPKPMNEPRRPLPTRIAAEGEHSYPLRAFASVRAEFSQKPPSR